MKQTHKHTPIKLLVIIVISLSLIGATGASAQRLLRDQSRPASVISITTQDQNVAVAAIVKAEQANLRDRPGKSGSVVRTVNQGDLLTLIAATPVGPCIEFAMPRAIPRAGFTGIRSHSCEHRKSLQSIRLLLNANLAPYRQFPVAPM